MSDIDELLPKAYPGLSTNTLGISVGDYQQVSFADDWDTIRYKGESRSKGYFEIIGDVVRVTKRTYEWIPDLEAQADLRALAAKWKAEGKNYLDDIEDQPDYEGGGLSVHELGRQEVTDTPEDWPLAECTFWKYHSSDVGLKTLIGKLR